jgi:hypothetical protein
MTEPDLSLSAELLLLAVNPAHGGLLPRRRRRRLRNALTAARMVDDSSARGTAFSGWRAGRVARRELLSADLIERKVLLRTAKLTDRRPAGRRFRALWDCIEADEFPDQRSRDLAVLLASSGVLAERLTSHQRWIAWRRLKGLMARDETGAWVVPLTGAAPLSDGIAALGVAAFRGIEGLVTDSVDGSGGGMYPGGDGGGDSGQ